MKQKTIPLEGYTDGVRKIITRSVADQQKFKDMIRTLSMEDIKNAIQILKDYDTAKFKIKELETELRVRELPEIETPRGKWAEEFKKEWNEMRKAAGKKK